MTSSCQYYNASVRTGVLLMECRDRYFMIAVNLSFTGEDPQFEVVGKRRLAPSKKKILMSVEL